MNGLFGLLLAGGLLLSGAAAAKNVIKLGSGEWAPYQGKDLPHRGFASRIVTKAFEKVGVKVEYGYYPWARSLEFARDGTVNGTFLWSHKKEREKDFWYSDEVIAVNYVFFHMKSQKFSWQKVEDLKGYRIGTTEKYTYGESFDNAVKAGILKVSTVPKDELNFKKLFAGRIQVFPNEMDAGYKLIKKHFSAEDARKFTHHDQPVRRAPHYILFSKKDPKNKEYRDLFNKGLKQLRASGEFKRFVEEGRSPLVH